MAPVRVRDVVLISEQIPRDVQVAAVVASGESDLRGRIGGRTAAHHQRPDRLAGEQAGKRRRGCAGRGFAGEEITRAREADAHRIEKIRIEDVRFFHARDLFVQAVDIRAVSVDAGGREIGAVVDRVNGRAGCLSSEKRWSRRSVAKVSRMVCSGLLSASEIPPKSGAPGVATGHALISDETPTKTRPEAGQGFGAGVTSLQGSDPARAASSGTRSTPV